MTHRTVLVANNHEATTIDRGGPGAAGTLAAAEISVKCSMRVATHNVPRREVNMQLEPRATMSSLLDSIEVVFYRLAEGAAPVTRCLRLATPPARRQALWRSVLGARGGSGSIRIARSVSDDVPGRGARGSRIMRQVLKSRPVELQDAAQARRRPQG